MTEPTPEESRQYRANTLSRSQLLAKPMAQFDHWLADARAAKLIDATAMNLSTVGSDNQPHSRIVLLKNTSEDGFTWYTYQESDKGQQLQQNPKACLLFYWRELERQVRVEGSVVKLDPANADEYFYSRPEGSRFSAAASIQSSPVENRAQLEQRVAQLHEEYPDGNVPRPSVWGGYLLQPARFEFWQGRDDRLHDRFIYTPNEQGEWMVQRLSP